MMFYLPSHIIAFDMIAVNCTNYENPHNAIFSNLLTYNLQGVHSVVLTYIYKIKKTRPGNIEIKSMEHHITSEKYDCSIRKSIGSRNKTN
jgi:hypothetical protein